jgi:predicted PurR-regulated permease PerM
VSVFGAVTQWLTMAVLGLPLAFPIAVLTFLGGFIPYVGTFITTGLGFIVAVAAGDPFDIAVMAVFTVMFNIVQGNFVAPLVYGRTVNLHPAVVLVAAPIGAAFGGLLGMMVVVPIFGIIAATWRSIIYVFDPRDEHRVLETLRSNDGVARPAAAP